MGLGVGLGVGVGLGLGLGFNIPHATWLGLGLDRLAHPGHHRRALTLVLGARGVGGVGLGSVRGRARAWGARVGVGGVGLVEG